MSRKKTTVPLPSRHTGQRSLDEPLYLVRPFFNWNQPTWVTSEAWRRVVQSQQVCMICRETLIGNILSLDWTIDPRDSSQRDELKGEIDYYTKLFESTGDYDYSEIIEWIGTDLLDLPFGGAAELGRAGDNPAGRLLWIELLDGGTLYPTLNRDWPIGQYVPQAVTQPVFFPRHSINRVYMSPRTELNRKGWGMAPPEKIWMSLNLLSTGDTYYAKLLLDTPQAGILDLVDMEKESAKEWVDGWRKLLTGVDPQKIPVLYEHNNPASWIPFTRNPSDIQYDAAIGRYTSILTAGYGLTPSDIALSAGGQNGGNTMAGNLRDERKSKHNGYARFKLKITAFFNRMLPPYLKFRFIDMDDELMVSLGRARLANATAWGAMITNNMFTEQEVRTQALADGMLSVTLPEEMPPELKKKVEMKQKMAENAANPVAPGGKPNAERPSMLGRPVTPSTGGWGETAARSAVAQSWIDTIAKADDKHFQRLAFMAYPAVAADAMGVWNALEDHGDIRDWVALQEEALWLDQSGENLPELSQLVLSTVKPQLLSDIVASDWWKFDREEELVETLAKYTDVVIAETKGVMELRSYVEQFTPAVVALDRGLVLEQVTANVQEVLSYVPMLIANSVISAVRDFVLHYQPVDMSEVVYSPELLTLIRSRLEMALVALSDVFAQNTSGIINAEFEKGAENNV